MSIELGGEGRRGGGFFFWRLCLLIKKNMVEIRK